MKQREASAAAVEASHQAQLALLEQRLETMAASESALVLTHEESIRELEARHAEARAEDVKRHESALELAVAARLSEARSRSAAEVAEAVEAHGYLKFWKLYFKSLA